MLPHTLRRAGVLARPAAWVGIPQFPKFPSRPNRRGDHFLSRTSSLQRRHELVERGLGCSPIPISPHGVHVAHGGFPTEPRRPAAQALRRPRGDAHRARPSFEGETKIGAMFRNIGANSKHQGHVSKPNPSRLTKFKTKFHASGRALRRLVRAIPAADLAPIRALLDQGCDLEAVILPIVARELPELPRPLKNWGAPWLGSPGLGPSRALFHWMRPARWPPTNSSQAMAGVRWTGGGTPTAVSFSEPESPA
jgi:hypothetical protein